MESGSPGWFCRNCEWAGDRQTVRKHPKCPECEDELTAWGDLDRYERELVELRRWTSEVRREGKMGPSPGGAAAELGCSRAMVDKLCFLGALERSEFRTSDNLIVFISSRSIERAKRAKEVTGKWVNGKWFREEVSGE